MEKIWLKNYPAGVPAEINPEAYQSLVDIFQQSCQKYQHKTALYSMGKRLSYGRLAELSEHFAAYLQQVCGLKPNERVAIMLPNVLQYPIAMFGALQAGLIVVNVNPLYTPAELVHQLNDAKVETIIVLANFAHVLAEALPKTGIRRVFITELGDLLGFPKSCLVNWVVKRIKKLVPPYQINNAIDFHKALRQGRQLHFEPVPIKPTDIAYLQYTGGTTGIAKGAILTHRNMVANLEQAYAWVAAGIQEGQEIVITALPLYHIFSLTANCLTFMKMGAMNVLITNPRDIASFIKTLQKIPFTAITGVNTLFNALLNRPEFQQLDFSHLKITLGGGMPVQQVVAERWQQVTGTCLVEAYGLTEASPAVAINPITLTTYNGKIGLPVPSTEISIRDDYDREVPLGEAGELCIKGPQVMAGYWHNPEETQKVFTHDGWLRTGDIAQMDEQGYLSIIDRKKDMIIVSGFNVYPNEIENILVKHPKILEAAVLGVPDANTGEAVKAYIVRRDNSLTEAEVIQYCRQYLTAYKIPKQIAFCQDLPKTNVGKILRRALREAANSSTLSAVG